MLPEVWGTAHLQNPVSSSFRHRGTEATWRVRVGREGDLPIGTLQASPPFPSNSEGPSLSLLLSDSAWRWLGQIWPIILSLNYKVWNLQYDLGKTPNLSGS